VERRLCKGTHTEDRRGAYRVLFGKPERNIPLGRPRYRWEHIKVDLKETGWEVIDRIHLVQDRDKWHAIVSAVTNHQVP